ncbi:hypothetical protein C8E87_3359 [Paractinoplanes brasiliensis]|uniref:Uncharacterized protein n=1 Tax=Paractinoplanes brasiliensis TaxID=52695 RepID=A0A4R6JSS7_9ACTN|nr:hypothetical protein C8E87_3359 [Actinoplanes brasiliensis]
MRPRSTELGCLLFNGFLVNRFGELTWHGEAEVWPVVVLAGTAGVGVAVRRLQAVLARKRSASTRRGRNACLCEGVARWLTWPWCC